MSVQAVDVRPLPAAGQPQVDHPEPVRAAAAEPPLVSQPSKRAQLAKHSLKQITNFFIRLVTYPVDFVINGGLVSLCGCLVYVVLLCAIGAPIVAVGAAIVAIALPIIIMLGVIFCMLSLLTSLASAVSELFEGIEGCMLAFSDDKEDRWHSHVYCQANNQKSLFHGGIVYHVKVVKKIIDTEPTSRDQPLLRRAENLLKKAVIGEGVAEKNIRARIITLTYVLKKSHKSLNSIEKQTEDKMLEQLKVYVDALETFQRQKDIAALQELMGRDEQQITKTQLLLEGSLCVLKAICSIVEKPLELVFGIAFIPIALAIGIAFVCACVAFCSVGSVIYIVGATISILLGALVGLFVSLFGTDNLVDECSEQYVKKTDQLPGLFPWYENEKAAQELQRAIENTHIPEQGLEEAKEQLVTNMLFKWIMPDVQAREMREETASLERKREQAAG